MFASSQKTLRLTQSFPFKTKIIAQLWGHSYNNLVYEQPLNKIPYRKDLAPLILAILEVYKSSKDLEKLVNIELKTSVLLQAEIILDYGVDSEYYTLNIVKIKEEEVLPLPRIENYLTNKLPIFRRVAKQVIKKRDSEYS